MQAGRLEPPPQALVPGLYFGMGWFALNDLTISKAVQQSFTQPREGEDEGTTEQRMGCVEKMQLWFPIHLTASKVILSSFIDYGLYVQLRGGRME